MALSGLLTTVPDADRLSRTHLADIDAWVVANRCPEGHHTRVLVMLHGYGMTPRGLKRIARQYAARHCAAMVFPEAPVALRGDRRVWWSAPPSVWHVEVPDWETLPAGLSEARTRIIALLDAVRARWQLDHHDIVLAGYSQGATLAAEVALHQPTLGGLLVLCGRFVAARSWDRRFEHLAQATAVIVHGRADPIAPHWAAQYLKRRLERAGAVIQWIAYNGGHKPPSAVDRAFHRALGSALELRDT